jgi:hypothetical protein
MRSGENIMNALVKHIEELNAKTQKWMDENPGSWGGMIVTDPAHWAEYDVYTVEDFERYQLETYIYEGHKDAFGVKGRHYDFKSMSMEQLKEEADYISRSVKNAIEEEEKMEKEAIENFENNISNNLEMGAKTREDAIRWVLQSEGLDKEQDASYICYNLGLPYSMEKVFESIIKEAA